jgi:UDP:flavonoid glycosyltransferase YjiC (YdhE family)
MAKILFLMWPEKGHLNSSLKIAETLKSQRHTVVYSQPFEFEEYVRLQGFELTPFLGELFPKGCPFTRITLCHCLKN